MIRRPALLILALVLALTGSAQAQGLGARRIGLTGDPPAGAPHRYFDSGQEVARIDLTGDWALTMQGPQGLVNMTLAVVQEDAALTGTLDGPMGLLEIEGESTEEGVTFRASVGTPDGAFDLVFSGTIEENKKISGWMQAGDGEVTIEFTAERVER